MNRKNTMLHGRSQTQKVIQGASFTENVQHSKSMETESTLMPVRGSMKGKMASNCQ